ncbi:MAG: hypothetical protein ACOY4T_05395 [Pseudomonadota bacterium]
MDEIKDYERRIAAAFDRIVAQMAAFAAAPGLPGSGRSGGPAGDTGGDAGTGLGGAAGEIAALRDALEAERTANAQLTERVRAIREKQETVVASLERTVARLSQQLDAQGRELARLKRANAGLTETSRALAAAAEAGPPDAGSVNRALAAELEALRAARAAEIAEMDEILSELKPLIGEVA